ncbi:hypothetical protein CfE428DRAFT_2048 [Chthoniobacter flavus Ellin428]|uniref:3-keto-disaccharide hydrolase domain-containing protein n=1 Tax=Chthoniobacter flavus Ellin428 TaxID=497964 RepID=B4CZG0_9BACT|nr:hypothetical protein [Chthoniobacter flavus]EDY20124.1 hypothetical protein CfE428DRAFT_2048 [Chthoniobacter flavus Ellin428]TCO94024.1 hypothetical protein EV701_103110 [Chthoniobacter flavus]
MKLPHLLGVLALVFTFTAPLSFAGTLVDDHFTAPQLAGRDLSPGRGVWTVADGMATCTQDDALYEKNKNHGPIMWYNATFTDGTVRFAIRAEKVKMFIFTLNDDKGHVFRFVVGQNPLSVHAWKEQGHDAKADTMPVKDAPKLPEGEWVQAELKFEGDHCTLSFGDTFKQTVEHPSIAKPKTKVGLAFAFGTLSVRDVSVVTP